MLRPAKAITSPCRKSSSSARRLMTDLTTLTIAEARAGLAGKKFSAAELTDAHLDAMERARALIACMLKTPDQTRAMAKHADARLAGGETRPLEGIPIAVKDM